jgi:hypothetical protein
VAAGPNHEAFPGVLNGGIIGTLLDCHCNWTAAYHLMRGSGPTDRRRRSPPSTTSTCSADTDRRAGDAPREGRRVDRRRATVEGTIEAGGQVTATCRARSSPSSPATRPTSAGSGRRRAARRRSPLSSRRPVAHQVVAGAAIALDAGDGSPRLAAQADDVVEREVSLAQPVSSSAAPLSATATSSGMGRRQHGGRLVAEHRRDAAAQGVRRVTGATWPACFSSTVARAARSWSASHVDGSNSRRSAR